MVWGQLASGIASAAAPAAMNAIGNYAGNRMQTAQGNQVARNMGNAQQVHDYLSAAGVTLSPDEQMKLQHHHNQQTAQQQQSLDQGNIAYNAPIFNQAENLNTQRNMAVNAQQNAANMAQAHLNALGQARQQAAGSFQNATNAMAQAFHR